MTNAAVSNSTCLIGLERIGRLDLLPGLFPSFYVPPAVGAEFGTLPAWFIVRPVQNTALVLALKMQVDDGEAEAIALAAEMNNPLIILDDRKARRVAQQMGLKIIGTAGVLLRAKRQGMISEIKSFLDALQQADFRISAALYNEALRLAGEYENEQVS